MNIQFTAKPMGEVQAYLAESAARHRRLMSPAIRAVSPVAPKTVEPSPRRLIYRAHDAHVIAWQKWKASAGSPLRNYIQQRCEELGVPYLAVVGQSRKSKVVEVRHLLMWEIRTKVKPSISYPELGRIFGGRDHTSALSACRKMEARFATLNGKEG